MMGNSINTLTRTILGACFEVHSELGPGLLESAYEECLCFVLHQRGIEFQRQVPMPVLFRGHRLDCGFRLDLLVEKQVVVEIKAVERLLPVHDAQLLTYLKVSALQVGLIINFNTCSLRDGVRRKVHGLAESELEMIL